jgi:hypothetical protein
VSTSQDCRAAQPRWELSKVTVLPTKIGTGTCSNVVRERNEYVVAQLLAELERSVLQPQAIEYALARFELELERELSTASGSIESQRKRMG